MIRGRTARRTAWRAIDSSLRALRFPCSLLDRRRTQELGGFGAQREPAKPEGVQQEQLVEDSCSGSQLVTKKCSASHQNPEDSVGRQSRAESHLRRAHPDRRHQRMPPDFEDHRNRILSHQMR
ncbi:hypothetical protein NDU88_008840 [Pleurodeles waltl]|uniref:Uncharacterized protein n=1 Tax=Pleurodeles waltl TaxID=8319 RepID=A0AAV7QT46_PLEWA|nr:hypothetical protein NDU88_008840 [Pleurodeles waltl]